MKKILYLMSLISIGVASAGAVVVFESPEQAVRALEDAYAMRNADAAVAARDFDEEARRMLLRVKPGLESQPDILKQTAGVLELGYRQELKQKTFSRFTGVRCTITKVVPIDVTLVQVFEDCTLKNGAVSKERLHVAKTKNGWRVITVPD